jgi:hypothetical protein
MEEVRLGAASARYNVLVAWKTLCSSVTSILRDPIPLKDRLTPHNNDSEYTSYLLAMMYMPLPATRAQYSIFELVSQARESVTHGGAKAAHLGCGWHVWQRWSVF